LPQLEEPELGPEKHPQQGEEQQGEEGEEGGWAIHNSNRPCGIRSIFLFVLHGPPPVPWLMLKLFPSYCSSQGTYEENEYGET